ncbi:MAG: Mut7-C ubiquitin/RNAse domain-containing protein [Syntrophomonadaceae bacterium]|nr:Mut7-C ubiquitin/RNAse domain-containing protein [Syntrophomonadaceae bacterium]
MSRIKIRFYAQLNDFITPERQGKTFDHSFNGSASVKDVIESLGVPHTEVDLILIDGNSAPFSDLLEGGESVAVYPAFKNLDLGDTSKVRPMPLSEYRFVLDSHLGKLAAYLRMLGFDAIYRNMFDDADIAAISARDKRILLTCDHGLLKRKEVVYGCFIRSKLPALQLKEVLTRFDLFSKIRPFTRCMKCNGILEPVDKESIISRLPAKVDEFYDEFSKCRDCGQLYWPGTHYERMKELISNVAHMDIL